MRPHLLVVSAAALLALGLLGPAVAPTPPVDTGHEAPAGASARAGLAAATGTRSVPTPVLQARATLAADHSAPGPDSGAAATPANGRRGPFDGQVVPGFSGVVANGNGTYWAMPDNGFGSKQNSADFRLRIYLVRPSFERAAGGRGRIEIERYLSLRDPARKIGFPLVRGGTRARLLTGADLDPESLVRLKDGTFWLGEEFGPFLVHVDRRGRVLSAPVPFPGGPSPESPTRGRDEAPGVRSSRGFEALAASASGTRLYAVVEGAQVGDPDPRRRFVYEFDTTRERYTGRRWAYRTDTDANLVADAHLVGRRQLVVVERDSRQGPAAVTKRVYRVDLDRVNDEGFAKKTLVLDLLKIDNPARIGVRRSPGAYGVGRRFSFPFQSVETVVPLGGDRYLLANDNNYPGNDARYPGRPDDTEMVIVQLPDRRVRVP